MPEGDTIHRSARALRAALLGRTLRQVEVPRSATAQPAVGSQVVRIEARGKHLLIGTSDGLVIHTHQRMTGAWHLYRRGERWRKARSAARVVLGTDDTVAVCFSSPIVEVLDVTALRRHPALRALGPDLCDPATEPEEAARRLGRLVAVGTSLGEALLDQRVASGIGNVYRCDVLFLHGIDPATPVEAIGHETRTALFTTAASLLRANLDRAERTTAPAHGAGALWVHGRAGQPCRRCGTAIEISRLGEHARYVYWCPTCQQRP